MFYKIMRTIAHFLASIVFELHFEGLENIPKDTGFILAANHRSIVDPVFCVVKVKNKLGVMAKEELFRNRFLAWFFRHMGAFPVDRGSGDNTPIEMANHVIEDGGALLIFPEGTRSKTGLPLRPRLGISLIAGQTQANVLPCTIDYGAKLTFRTKITIKYHPVLTAEELAIDPETPATMRAASRKIMDSIESGMTHIPELEAAVKAEKEATK